jgi:diguanylate cyclase (GGDEF)-like protein
VIEGLANPAVMAAAPELRQLILFDRAAAPPYLGAIFVLDVAGNIIIDSASIKPRLFNYVDRDYFKAQAERPDAGLYIGKPIISRSTGQMIIGLSRRINKPDGSFGGIVVGTLQLAYVHNLFSRVKLGNGGSLTLFRTDGTVVMREPYNAAQIGLILKPPMLFAHLATAAEGEYQAKSVLDGVERLFHYARVGTLPLVQNVALSIEDIYADWWRKVIAIAVGLAACCGVIAALAVALRPELMRRAKAETALFQLAKEDCLTGIANRRYFEERLETEWAIALRHRIPLCVMMIDVDHFKAFNDTFGHLAGDRALAALGGILRARASRGGELVARYGGEEFAVILPMTHETAALEIAEAIRRDVLSLALSTPDDAHRLSVSVGIGRMIPQSGLAPHDLVAEADAALYASKTNGRNRSTLHASHVTAPLQTAVAS